MPDRAIRERHAKRPRSDGPFGSELVLTVTRFTQTRPRAFVRTQVVEHNLAREVAHSLTARRLYVREYFAVP